MRVAGWKVEFAGEASESEKMVIADHLLKNQKCAKVIKKGRHRIVERILAEGVDIHAKTNYLHNLRAKFRRFLRPCKSQLEFCVLRELDKAGVRSLEPLAWAEESRIFGPSVLYTRTLEDSKTLEELWKTSWRILDSQSRQRICRNFGILLAQTHECGLLHPDPHPGNILVLGDSLDLRIIDLHNPIRLGNITKAQRTLDIARWAQWGSLRLETIELARILGNYLIRSGFDEFQTWWIAISRKSLELQKRFWARQEPLCLHSGHRRFSMLNGQGKTGVALAGYDHLVKKFWDVFSSQGTPRHPLPVIKSSPSSQVYKTTAEGIRIVIKVIPHKKRLKEKLASFFGANPAKRQWYWSNALRLRLLQTPKALGWYHDSYSGCSFFLAEELSGALQLDQWLNDQGGKLLPKRAMIRKLAKSVRILHQRGIYNRDMKAANVMVDSQNEINWVDLGGMGHLIKTDSMRSSKDLSRLAGSFWDSPHITHSDRLRFLKGFLTANQYSSNGWKRHWLLIQDLSSQRIRARIKAGRPLG